jgi:hypothetical protein
VDIGRKEAKGIVNVANSEEAKRVSSIGGEQGV